MNFNVYRFTLFRPDFFSISFVVRIVGGFVSVFISHFILKTDGLLKNVWFFLLTKMVFQFLNCFFFCIFFLSLFFARVDPEFYGEIFKFFNIQISSRILNFVLLQTGNAANCLFEQHTKLSTVSHKQAVRNGGRRSTFAPVRV